MIKVDVISGFLGAGKTTLIRKLLKDYVNDEVVLIENEFGEIGIDGELIKRDGIEVYEISSGCICCIMQDDFKELLEKVINDLKPKRIVIEPTGISILSDIVEVLNDERFNEKIEINSLITVVDAINYFEQEEIFGEFFDDQISNATALIMSKTQLIEREKVEDVIKSLEHRNSKAKIISEKWDYLDTFKTGNILTGEIEDGLKDLFRPDYRPCSDNRFKTYAFISTHRFKREELNSALENLCNKSVGKVIRGKGFLKGVSGGFEFSFTNKIFEVKEVSYEVSGRICFIGTEIVEEEVGKLFKNKSDGIFKCLTS